MEVQIFEIADQFSLGRVENFRRLENGLINESFQVVTDRGQFILQKLSPIWDERVISDYLAVQSYLRTSGVHVPVLLNDRNEKPVYVKEKCLWRAFEYIPHDLVENPDPELAFEAGALLGKFHTTMAKNSFNPTFRLPGYRDTPAIVKKLRVVYSDSIYSDKVKKVLREYALISNIIESHYLPNNDGKIVIHGDPKFNNFLFKGGKAIALLDLDTLMMGSPLLDVGDAFRSWCRKKPSTSEFLPEIFNAALKGYRSQSCFEIGASEAKNAMSLITLELSARYLIDYFEESYFPLKPKYSCKAEQNLARCRRYLEYYRNFTGGVKENHLLAWGLNIAIE
ncbi:MAG: phosphotransferase [Nanoarchaeota archaeon]